MNRHLLNLLTAVSLLWFVAVAGAAVWAQQNNARVLFYLPYVDGYWLSSYYGQLCLVKRGTLVARDYWCSLPASFVPIAVLSSLWLKHARREARSRRASRGLCRACGYDLTGNVSGACPECGERW